VDKSENIFLFNIMRTKWNGQLGFLG